MNIITKGKLPFLNPGLNLKAIILAIDSNLPSNPSSSSSFTSNTRLVLLFLFPAPIPLNLPNMFHLLRVVSSGILLPIVPEFLRLPFRSVGDVKPKAELNNPVLLSRFGRSSLYVEEGKEEVIGV